MSVAAATSTVSRPSSFMTPRGSDAVDRGAGTPSAADASLGGPTQTATGAEAPEPLVNRFPTIAFSYDTDASRLVMLYRDPASGKTVSQIPTEAALKQYKEAQQQEKAAERASLLKLTVDGDGGSGGGWAADDRAGGTRANAGGAAAGKGNWTVGMTGSAGTHAASSAIAASAGASSVARSTTAASGSAAVSTARVNVVI